MPVKSMHLRGERFCLRSGDPGFPAVLRTIPRPPERLWGVGSVSALREGLAVVGARRATPYGRGAAKRFATRAAEKGVVIISGGARGCDSVAHEAALSVGTPTVAFMGGGCNQLYPAENAGLFQRIIDGGGAVVSEHDWDFPPQGYTFRERNRLIAGMARAALIVEAGLPSGTFSTADEALAAGREVWVVPGAITSTNSRGANRLLYQGALPIVDDEALDDALFLAFGCLKEPGLPSAEKQASPPGASEARAIAGGRGVQVSGAVPWDDDSAGGALLEALQAEPLGMEALRNLARIHGPREDSFTWLMVWLATAQSEGLIAQYPDGRYGPAPNYRRR